MLDFRLSEVVAFIEKSKAQLVALQLPEGLKLHGIEIAEELERRSGCNCIILGDPCYGACDVNTSYLDFADVLIHFGHSEMPSIYESENVMFVEVFIDYDICDILSEAMPSLRHRIGLVTTAQHLPLLAKAKDWLEAQGKTVLIGSGDRRVRHPGQVLGCNVSSARSIADQVEQFLYIGSGDFHPLAVSLDTGKGVIVVDPLMREVRVMEELKDKILRQRHGAIARSREAQNFGILVSSKVGQKRMDLALRMKALIVKKGRKANIIILDNIDPDQLLAFKVDAFVSTACPRLAIDDYLRFKKPILTALELEIVLGLRDWSDYAFDSIIG